jgi:hypothetical protein
MSGPRIGPRPETVLIDVERAFQSNTLFLTFDVIISISPFNAGLLNASAQFRHAIGVISRFIQNPVFDGLELTLFTRET